MDMVEQAKRYAGTRYSKEWAQGFEWGTCYPLLSNGLVIGVVSAELPGQYATDHGTMATADWDLIRDEYAVFAETDNAEG